MRLYRNVVFDNECKAAESLNSCHENVRLLFRKSTRSPSKFRLSYLGKVNPK